MNESYDQSHLDRKYFIDREKYNCPFCNRKSITYSVVGEVIFNWSNERRVHGYLIRCGGDTCGKISFHLSEEKIYLNGNKFWYVSREDEGGDYKDIHMPSLEIDHLFFYHQPTTFFTLDNRINEKVRKLVSEAEGCAKMSYLVGASGCLRKAIYQLLEIEKISKVNDKGKEVDYGERIKILKSKYPTVPAEYFDALSNIQGMTSKQLHEGGWRPWSQAQFHFLVETVKEILTEVYVRPQEKSSVLQKILSLKPEKESPVE